MRPLTFRDPAFIGKRSAGNTVATPVSIWHFNESASPSVDAVSALELPWDGSFSSNASGKLNRSLRIPDATDKNPSPLVISLGASVSLWGWFYVRSHGIGTSSFEVGLYNTSAGKYAAKLGLYTQRFFFDVGFTGAGSGLVEAASAGNIGLDAWHFVCAWFDGSTSRIQVDNGAVDMASTSGTPVDGEDFKLVNYSTGTSIDIELDELCFANGVPGSAQRAALWNGGAGVES